MLICLPRNKRSSISSVLKPNFTLFMVPSGFNDGRPYDHIFFNDGSNEIDACEKLLLVLTLMASDNSGVLPSDNTMNTGLFFVVLTLSWWTLLSPSPSSLVL